MSTPFQCPHCQHQWGDTTIDLPASHCPACHAVQPVPSVDVDLASSIDSLDIPTFEAAPGLESATAFDSAPAVESAPAVDLASGFNAGGDSLSGGPQSPEPSPVSADPPPRPTLPLPAIIAGVVVAALLLMVMVGVAFYLILRDPISASIADSTAIRSGSTNSADASSGLDNDSSGDQVNGAPVRSDVAHLPWVEEAEMKRKLGLAGPTATSSRATSPPAASQTAKNAKASEPQFLEGKLEEESLAQAVVSLVLRRNSQAFQGPAEIRGGFKIREKGREHWLVMPTSGILFPVLGNEGVRIGTPMGKRYSSVGFRMRGFDQRLGIMIAKTEIRGGCPTVPLTKMTPDQIDADLRVTGYDLLTMQVTAGMSLVNNMLVPQVETRPARLVRDDDADETSEGLWRLDVDGPPTAAGSLVTTPDGSVVAMTVTNSTPQGHAWAIPAEKILQFASQGIGKVDASHLSLLGDQLIFGFTYDPFNADGVIAKSEVLIHRMDSPPEIEPTEGGFYSPILGEPIANQALRPLSGNVRSKLVIDDVKNSASVESLWYQGKVTRKDKSVAYTRPEPLSSVFQLNPSPDGSPLGPDARLTLNPSIRSGFSLDRVTGDIACVDAISAQAYLYSEDKLAVGGVGQPVEIPLPAKATSTCFKTIGQKRYLLATILKPRSLAIIDLETKQLIHAEDFSSPDASANETGIPLEIASSIDPDDPWIYVRDFDGIIAFHVTTQERFKVDVPSALLCQLSGDGDYLYLKLNTHGSGRAVKVYRRNWRDSASVPALVACGSLASHSGADPIAADPTGHLVGYHNQLCLADGTEKIDLKNQVIEAIVGQTPVALATHHDSNSGYVGKMSLLATSFLNPKATRPILNLTPAIKPIKRSKPHETKYFADLPRGRILIAGPDRFVSVPMEDLPIMDQPLLIPATLQATVRMGQRVEMPLAEVSDGVQLTADGLPDGAAVANGTLNWIPTREQIGMHSIKIELSADKQSRSYEVPINVVSPSIQSPINITGIRVDPASRFAVVWESPEPRTRHRSNSGQADGPSQKSPWFLFGGIKVLGSSRIKAGSWGSN